MFYTANPLDNQRLVEFPTLSTTDIQERLALAEQVYRTHWRLLAVPERAAVVRLIAEQLQANATTYAQLITIEMGKPIRQALAEIEKCAWLCTYFADHAANFLSEQIVSTEYYKSYVRFEPIGAVLGIMPWNFPFWQVFRFAIPACLAGNVIILKPAPNVPQCSLAIEQLFVTATKKRGIFQTVFAEIADIESVIAHPVVQGVALTGSDRAGASVAALAGKHLKKCVMELGGSDAFIVLEDADIKAAAQAAVQSRMNNAGQTCIAAKRLIVMESIASAFLDALRQELEGLTVGNPMDESTDVGPMARPDLQQQLVQQVEKTLQQGAICWYQKDDAMNAGNFFQPTVLLHVPPGSPAYVEELFGPVAAVFMVPTEEEAINLANDTPYGLGAAIWSADWARAERLSTQLEVGFVAINDIVKSDPRLPFGGIKRSGFGRELGALGIKEFVNTKIVVIK